MDGEVDKVEDILRHLVADTVASVQNEFVSWSVDLSTASHKIGEHVKKSGLQACTSVSIAYPKTSSTELIISCQRHWTVS